MKVFFEAYKKYIIKHPNKLEYKPTSDNKYDSRKLLEIISVPLKSGPVKY